MKYTVLLLLIIGITPLYAQQDSYLSSALQAENWLHSLEKKDSIGLYWPDVQDSTYSTTDIYAGNSGVVLFYLELFYTTKNKKYLGIAENAMQHIAATMPSFLTEENCGLYTGAAGIVYALHQTAVASGKKKYLEKTASLLRLLQAKVINSDSIQNIANDIVYGYAGIGLTFLYAAKHSLFPDAKKYAAAIGNIILSRSIKADAGIRWPMFMQDTARKFYLPNFSHGTAGVAYFLACLYETTKDKKYLDAVLQAAAHLESIANKDGFIYHAEPNKDAMNRYYLSWCHGPAGTARLYQKLYSITGNGRWKEKIFTAAAALQKCGIPEKQTTGYWNNVSYCCGNAGIAEFYLQLYQLYKNEMHLLFSEHMLNNLLQRATAGENKLSWKQAENRTQPTLLQAQTGLMQGAAGIGLTLLHINAVKNNKMYRIKLPDNPF